MGSSQLAPSHGHSLAALQVTPKATLCKQEISGSHLDSSKISLGLDGGASRLDIPPHLPSPSASSLCKSQRETPPKCNGGTMGQQQIIGKNPCKALCSTQPWPGLGQHLTHLLSLLQGQVGGSQGLDRADDFPQLQVTEVAPDVAIELLGFFPPHLREVLLLQRRLDLRGERGHGDSGHVSAQVMV